MKKYSLTLLVAFFALITITPPAKAVPICVQQFTYHTMSLYEDLGVTVYNMIGCQPTHPDAYTWDGICMLCESTNCATANGGSLFVLTLDRGRSQPILVGEATVRCYNGHSQTISIYIPANTTQIAFKFVADCDGVSKCTVTKCNAQ